MSQENVEIVRRSMQAFNDSDFPALESIYSAVFVFCMIGCFADLVGSESRGRDAALDFMREWIETIDARGKIETIRRVNDQLFAIVNHAATGAASGVDTTLRVGHVYSFRDAR